VRGRNRCPISVYARTQRIPEAVELLRNVLASDPQHFRGNLLLGRILSLQHQPEEALPYLKQAASAEPANFEAHAFLADAYDAMGESQTAASERARSESLKGNEKR